MNNAFIKYTGLLSLVALLNMGCTKSFDKINTNPASYSQSTFDPNYVLTTAELGYTGSADFAYDTWRGNLIYCSTMMQGFASVLGYWAGDKYLLNSGYTAAYWGFDAGYNGSVNGDGAYPEQVKPIVDIVQSTAGQDKYNNLHQIARILRVLMLERITDLYGDAPYFNAGMGYYNKDFFPKYDSQDSIYLDMLKEVTNAVSLLSTTGDQPSGDVIYPGSNKIAQWQRFGNSLILRLAMRLVKVDPATAQTYLQQIVGKTFVDNTDNAYVLGDATGGRPTQNRNSQILLGDGGQENFYTRWSATFISTLKSTNDPRLGKVAVTDLYVNDQTKTQNPAYDATPADQKGMPNGFDTYTPGYLITSTPTFTAYTDYSSPNPYMIQRGGPTFILTYAETELLWAEAAARFSIGGDPATHYANGVKAAMTYLSQYNPAIAVSDADAQAYVLANPYNATNGLQMINTQYWIHTCTNLDFYECWCNWRRSGYPVLTPVNFPNNATNGTIPRRFPYPLNEANTNPVNYQAAHSAVPGGDVMTSRVWWDKQ